MKKSNKILNKIMCMFFVVVCCLSCINFSAFAEEINPNAEYGEDIGGNIIPLPTGTGAGNTLVRVPDANRNADTLIFLMDYVQYLYSYNMTNGQKPFLIAFGLNSVEIYCTAIQANSVYVGNVVKRNSYRVFNLVVDEQSSQSNAVYQRYLLHAFGNFNISGEVSSTSEVQIYMSGNTDIYGYIYLMPDGSYVYYATSTTTEGVYAPLVDMYLDMKTFINDSYGSLPGIPGDEQGVVLDIGSIITAVMTAPMIVFGGLTGTPGDLSQSLNLFGVDIRAAIISILVIAIVVFIIKFLRGG